MHTSKTSFFYVLAKSLLIYKQSFFYLFFLSFVGFSPIYFADKVILKVTIGLYYYNIAGKFFLDYFIFFIVYLACFFLFLYYLCAGLIFINSIYYKRKESFRNIVITSKGLFINYILVIIYLMIKILIGLIFFILPGIMFIFLYSFAGFAVLFDNKKGQDALNYSKNIVSKTWIQYLDYLLVVIAVVFSVLCLNYICDFVIDYFNNYNISSVANLVDLLSTAVIILTWNFILVYFVCVYNMLKKQEEEGR